MRYDSPQATSAYTSLGKGNVPFDPRELILKQTSSATENSTSRYLGNIYEETDKGGVTYQKHFVTIGGHSVGVSVQTIKDQTGSTAHYMHRDKLGSVSAITNEAGDVISRYYYDVFGRQYGATDNSAIDGVPVTLRGYTIHRDIPGMDLIHMGGRVYDPLLGRFTSADPFVTNPLFSQGFNRYSYVLNNPLKFTDPSGFHEDDHDVNTFGYDTDTGTSTGSGNSDNPTDPMHDEHPSDCSSGCNDGGDGNSDSSSSGNTSGSSDGGSNDISGMNNTAANASANANPAAAQASVPARAIVTTLAPVAVPAPVTFFTVLDIVLDIVSIADLIAGTHGLLAVGITGIKTGVKVGAKGAGKASKSSTKETATLGTPRGTCPSCGGRTSSNESQIAKDLNMSPKDVKDKIHGVKNDERIGGTSSRNPNVEVCSKCGDVSPQVGGKNGDVVGDPIGNIIYD